MAVSSGLYIISVAASLLGMHPQTLRKYERVGLIVPSRTGGMLRLYSAEDIARLKLIKHLVEDLELNLAGVELVLGLVNRLETMSELTESLEKTAKREQILRAVRDMLETIGLEKVEAKARPIVKQSSLVIYTR